MGGRWYARTTILALAALLEVHALTVPVITVPANISTTTMTSSSSSVVIPIVVPLATCIPSTCDRPLCSGGTEQFTSAVQISSLDATNAGLICGTNSIVSPLANAICDTDVTSNGGQPTVESCALECLQNCACNSFALTDGIPSNMDTVCTLYTTSAATDTNPLVIPTSGTGSSVIYDVACFEPVCVSSSSSSSSSTAISSTSSSSSSSSSSSTSMISTSTSSSISFTGSSTVTCLTPSPTDPTQNGGFDTGSFAPWTVTTTGDGTSTYSLKYGYGLNSPYTADMKCTGPKNGNQAKIMLSQVLTTVPGTTYDVYFSYMLEYDAGAYPENYLVGLSGPYPSNHQDLDTLITIHGSNPDSTGNYEYTWNTVVTNFPLIATTTQTILEFDFVCTPASRGPRTMEWFFDQVSVIPRVPAGCSPSGSSSSSIAMGTTITGTTSSSAILSSTSTFRNSSTSTSTSTSISTSFSPISNSSTSSLSSTTFFISNSTFASTTSSSTTFSDSSITSSSFTNSTSGVTPASASVSSTTCLSNQTISSTSALSISSNSLTLTTNRGPTSSSIVSGPYSNTTQIGGASTSSSLATVSSSYVRSTASSASMISTSSSTTLTDASSTVTSSLLPASGIQSGSISHIQTLSPSLTTSTVFTTSIRTVMSCPPSVTNCPLGLVTTEIIALYTTVCPISSQGTPVADSPMPTRSVLTVSAFTMSTVYTTLVYTITKCPATVTKCPIGAVTTTVVSLYTIICPVSSLAPAGLVPTPLVVAGSSPVQKLPSASSAASPSITKVITITTSTILPQGGAGASTPSVPGSGYGSGSGSDSGSSLSMVASSAAAASGKSSTTTIIGVPSSPEVGSAAAASSKGPALTNEAGSSKGINHCMTVVVGFALLIVVVV